MSALSKLNLLGLLLIMQVSLLSIFLTEVLNPFFRIVVKFSLLITVT